MTSSSITTYIEKHITGFDAVSVIPLINLQPALSKTLQIMDNGLVPDTYSWTKEKTGYAYRYKNYSHWAKSIIVAAKYYYTDEKLPETQGFGRIARFTWRNNYRYLSMKLLESIELIKEKKGSSVQSKVLSNYTSIPEKVLFRYSGLADLGKNGVLISRNMGSYFSIGEAFIDLEIDFENELYLTPPNFSICGSCNLCKAACPTTAIIEDGIININRCFQYLSENLVLIPHKFREKWGARIYGCTTCLDVCPYNKKLEPWAEKHDIGFIGTGLDLIEALNMSQNKWIQKFSNNQLGIRDRIAVLKNVILAIGCIKYKRALDSLYPYLNHQNAIIRAYTAWSIGMIHSRTGLKKLNSRYKVEDSPMVKSEIEFFL